MPKKPHNSFLNFIAAKIGKWICEDIRQNVEGNDGGAAENDGDCAVKLTMKKVHFSEHINFFITVT